MSMPAIRHACSRAMSIAFAGYIACNAPSAWAKESRSKPDDAPHGYMICHLKKGGDWRNVGQCKDGLCTATCGPIRPVGPPHALRCNEAAINAVFSECRMRKDCHPLTLYYRLERRGCIFTTDDFWAPADAEPRNIRLVQAKDHKTVVDIDWMQPSCKRSELMDIETSSWPPGQTRETFYAALLRRGCNFDPAPARDPRLLELPNVEPGGGPETGGHQPEPQPRLRVRFVSAIAPCGTCGISTPIEGGDWRLGGQKLECSAPNSVFGPSVIAICTGEAPIPGIYTIIGAAPPFYVQTPTGEIAYLGFIWTGPVLVVKPDGLEPPPPSITIPIPPKAPGPGRFLIFSAAAGSIGLGALLSELIKRLLSQLRSRSNENEVRITYRNQLQDIVVLARSPRHIKVSATVPPDDWMK